MAWSILRAGLVAALASSVLQLAGAETSPFMAGFDYIAFGPGEYNSSLGDAAFATLADMHVSHIQVLVTWYMPTLNSTTISPTAATPTWDDLTHVVNSARARNITVIVKPHVDILTGEWRGEIGSRYSTQQQWDAFFASYTAYMIAVAKWAASQNGRVWGFNVGTEYVGTTTIEHTGAWRAVIAAVRGAFNGTLWYGANWGAEPWNVQFWDDLDYIGVDAYYPVTSGSDYGNASDIAAHWAVVNANLTTLAQKWGKSIVYAEIGYRSYAGAGINPGAWVGSPAPNAQAQLALWTGFFTNALPAPWLAGLFPWDWSASPFDGFVCDAGYSPNGKPAYALFQSEYAVLRGQPPPPQRLSADRAHGATAATPFIIYQDGATQWDDYSYYGNVSLSNTTQPYPGHAASASASLAPEGAFSLRLSGSPMNISEYSSFSFDIHVEDGDSTSAPLIQAWLCTCDDCTGCALRHAVAADYAAWSANASACALPPAWGAGMHVSIPFFDLGVGSAAYANSSQLKRFAIQYANTTGKTSFHLDNIVLT